MRPTCAPHLYLADRLVLVAQLQQALGRPGGGQVVEAEVSLADEVVLLVPASLAVVVKHLDLEPGVPVGAAQVPLRDEEVLPVGVEVVLLGLRLDDGCVGGGPAAAAPVVRPGDDVVRVRLAY